MEPVDNPSHEDHGAAEGPDAVEPVVNILHVHVPSYRVTCYQWSAAEPGRTEVSCRPG